MIPGGDHSSRSLLFRRIRSWSEITQRTPQRADTEHGDRDDARWNRESGPLLQIIPSYSTDGDHTDDDGVDNNDLSSPLLPHGHSLEYEEQSQESSDDNTSGGVDHPHRSRCSLFLSTDWKLWIVFGLLVASGVGNVIFAKLQSLPMYNYPTFLNIYANGMYVVMSFAYILPVSAMGLFGNSIQRSIPSSLFRPFFIMGALDALGAAMQFLATIYLPGTLLVLIPQVAIPLSMAAGSLVLREKYTIRQYIGAAVVCFGILVVLYPILSHQRDADYFCKAIDNENDCLLCKEEMTEELCLSHNTNHNGTDHNNTRQQYHFWRNLELHNISNSTINNNDDDDGLYCAWVSRKETNAREEDFLVFFWSIVMLLSCIPSVMSTVYKQVALQTASSMDPIVISTWVSLFQFICGLFLVIPSGLISSPRVHPLDLGSNWLDGIECLFAHTNSIESGCHPDDCAKAALWVHLSLLNSAVYALSMLFFLKYGSCDLMYLGLTLVVPIGHLAFDIHSSFSDLRVYDIAGLVILVAGLVMYRFGHLRNDPTSANDRDHSYRYEAITNQENNDDTATTLEGLDHDRDGFLEFLREPFRLVGDI